MWVVTEHFFVGKVYWIDILDGKKNFEASFTYVECDISLGIGFYAAFSALSAKDELMVVT